MGSNHTCMHGFMQSAVWLHAPAPLNWINPPNTLLESLFLNGHDLMFRNPFYLSIHRYLGSYCLDRVMKRNPYHDSTAMSIDGLFWALVVI